jgi:hypothetical protein
MVTVVARATEDMCAGIASMEAIGSWMFRVFGCGAGCCHGYRLYTLSLVLVTDVGCCHWCRLVVDICMGLLSLL